MRFQSAVLDSVASQLVKKVRGSQTAEALANPLA